MFTVTAAALKHLWRVLAGQNADDKQAMRLTCGWKLRLDRKRPDDTVFAHKGKGVLVLDLETAKAMAALTLDVHSAETGGKIELRRSACGSE